MPKYLNRDAEIRCSHGVPGKLMFSEQQVGFFINGSAVVLESDLLTAQFTGCGNMGDKKKPCSRIVQIIKGIASDVVIDGERPVLDTLDFVTDGVPPAQCGIVVNSSSDACPRELGDQEQWLSRDDWTLCNLRWSRPTAREGDFVQMLADTTNVPAGTRALVRIFERDLQSEDDFVRFFEVELTDGRICVDWEFEYHEDVDDILSDEEMRDYGGDYNPPEYYFTVTIAGRTFGANRESGLLKFRDSVDIQAVEPLTGRPVPDLRVEVTLPDGDVRTGRLDMNGRFMIDDVPPGRCRIRFPDLELNDRGATTD